MAQHAQDDREPGIRIDRWLWFARFFKSRNIATKLVQSSKVRLNRTVISKPSILIRPGDVLTFPQAKDIRVVRVLDIGERRGPAPEAQALYEDLVPKADADSTAGNPAGFGSAAKREKGAGRPTKAERRATDKLKPDPES